MLLILLQGCRVLPKYRLSSSSLHKDSILVTVYLEEPSGLEAYREIASTELQKLRSTRDHGRLPLYEVHFLFRGNDFPGEKWASIIVRLEEAALENLGSRHEEIPPHWEVYLY
jgi:hypothetical protein